MSSILLIAKCEITFKFPLSLWFSLHWWWTSCISDSFWSHAYLIFWTKISNFFLTVRLLIFIMKYQWKNTGFVTNKIWIGFQFYRLVLVSEPWQLCTLSVTQFPQITFQYLFFTSVQKLNLLLLKYRHFLCNSSSGMERMIMFKTIGGKTFIKSLAIW